jgi:hypothetical protein
MDSNPLPSMPRQGRLSSGDQSGKGMVELLAMWMALHARSHPKNDRESYGEARQIIRLYASPHHYLPAEQTHRPNLDIPVQVPGGKLGLIHQNYLRSRNFDPDYLEKEWNLKGTGPVGNYRFRVIAPIEFNHKIVSYQGRDVTNRQLEKYKACPKTDEAIHHKHILYGFDKARKKDSVVVVEGITDVWRLGPGAVCTFGIKYKTKQLSLLASYWNQVIVFFDNDELKDAKRQAEQLAFSLSSLDVCVKIAQGKRGSDPAKLTDTEAKEFMKENLL